MDKRVCIIGAGLAGSEAAIQLASRGIYVALVEARPNLDTLVHKSSLFAELVCSNSLKSEDPSTAAGLLKLELEKLGSRLYAVALENRVPAGKALAVDRSRFARDVTDIIEEHPNIEVIRDEAVGISAAGSVLLVGGEELGPFDAIVLASGPLTSDALSSWLVQVTGHSGLAFFDAAAPIVLTESLNMDGLFSQSRYEEGEGDYLNAPFTKEQYCTFIDKLLHADKVVAKEFESKELFQACQPIEEIARKGVDAPRFGPMKPVGLVDPHTGRRPWAAVQLRSEDRHGLSYNLVGFQTNLTFAEQQRVFRTIPGLERAEFARYGVMHRNTFLDAPRLMGARQEASFANGKICPPLYLAGQVSGTEGYCEAIRSGLQASLEIVQLFEEIDCGPVPTQTAYGSLLAYATDSDVKDYQPMHVNFGIMEPLGEPVKGKRERKEAYAKRAAGALEAYCVSLRDAGVLQ